MTIYNAAGVSSQDKAYAAFVIGNALFNLKDRRRGCDWVRTAAGRDPGNPTYTQLVQSQC